MKFEKLYADLAANKNAEKAEEMSAYMRNLFLYLGIPTPQRKAVCKPYFKNIKAQENIDWEFIALCWEQEYREFQYVAIEYLLLMRKKLVFDDINRIKDLAVSKSWWDTIDGLDKIAGDIALRYPEMNRILIEWSTDKNFWLRRIAIDHQLSRKNETDSVLLEQIIVNNFGQSEFFINKAIGWSLREYAKTNPAWVKDFIKRYRNSLSPLSLREAEKHLKGVENIE